MILFFPPLYISIHTVGNRFLWCVGQSCLNGSIWVSSNCDTWQHHTIKKQDDLWVNLDKLSKRSECFKFYWNSMLHYFMCGSRNIHGNIGIGVIFSGKQIPEHKFIQWWWRQKHIMSFKILSNLRLFQHNTKKADYHSQHLKSAQKILILNI